MDDNKPVTAPSTSSVNEHSTSMQAAINKRKILVVDDEPDARDLFGELLSTVPEYEVETAEDGNDCLAKCEATKYDLVLLDIVMPKMDGVEALAQIKGNKEKYGDPIIIMLTNIGGDIAIEKALELGAVGFKLKIDTEPEELLKTVDDALNHRPINNSAGKDLFQNSAENAAVTQ